MRKITKIKTSNSEEVTLNEIRLAKSLIDRPAPHCSAQSWVIFDRETNSALFGRMEKERREVASLTKILTLYTVLSFIDRKAIKLDTKIIIDEEAASVAGTSANLLAGDTFKLIDLFYGLMLPSGNDAAHALASFIGEILLKDK